MKGSGHQHWGRTGLVWILALTCSVTLDKLLIWSSVSTSETASTYLIGLNIKGTMYKQLSQGTRTRSWMNATALPILLQKSRGRRPQGLSWQLVRGMLRFPSAVRLSLSCVTWGPGWKMWCAKASLACPEPLQFLLAPELVFLVTLLYTSGMLLAGF